MRVFNLARRPSPHLSTPDESNESDDYVENSPEVPFYLSFKHFEMFGKF